MIILGPCDSRAGVALLHGQQSMYTSTGKVKNDFPYQSYQSSDCHVNEFDYNIAIVYQLQAAVSHTV